MTQDDNVINISVIKVTTCKRFISRIIRGESLKEYLGWSQEDKGLKRKTMLEHSRALMEQKKAVAPLCILSQNLSCSNPLRDV